MAEGLDEWDDGEIVGLSQGHQRQDVLHSGEHKTMKLSRFRSNDKFLQIRALSYHRIETSDSFQMIV